MRPGRATPTLTVCLVIEAIALGAWVWHHYQVMSDDYEATERRERLSLAEQKDALQLEFEATEYAATGETSFQRIYNDRRLGLVEMIATMAKESFPSDWTCTVKIEEFTKVLLLVQTPRQADQESLDVVLRSADPVLRNAGQYISNIAVLDRKHVCCFLLDQEALEILRQGQLLGPDKRTRAKELASGLTRFNGRRIELKRDNGHLFVPITVYGIDRVTECLMMLDTGASASVLPLKVIGDTGTEDLNRVSRQTFETANGRMTCPMVERILEAAGVQSKQLVAVSTQDKDVALLGVDFFRGKQYLVDFSEGALYIWDN